MDKHGPHRKEAEPADDAGQPALRTREDRAAALIRMAQRTVAKGKVGAAREVLSLLPRTAWGGPQRAALLSRIDLLRGCLKMGGETFVAVVAAAMPGTPDALYALGVCLASRGRYLEALEHLLLVVDRDPDYGAGVAKAAILRILVLAGERNQAAGQYWERLGRALHQPEPSGGRPDAL